MSDFVLETPQALEKDMRLDVYICSVLKTFTRSSLKAGLKELVVNGKKAKLSSKVKPLSEIRFSWQEEIPPFIEAQDIPLDIIFENEDVVVIDKKQGMVVHPALGNWQNTLVNALLFHNKKEAIRTRDGISTQEALRPGIVHRLDKETSGVMITAKTKKEKEFLTEQFLAHNLKKEYIAIAKGSLPQKEGIIDCNIARKKTDRKLFIATQNEDEGKNAITKYRVIKRYGEYSLLRLWLLTGRTHQIRVHLQYMGCPILGDSLYAKKDATFPNATLLLHSRMLEIAIAPHKIMQFISPVPVRFKEVLKVLRTFPSFPF